METTDIIIESIKPLLKEAALLVVRRQRASYSMLQMEFGLGYMQASELMDQLEYLGIVGEYEGKASRKVLVTDEEEIPKIPTLECE